jgi:hypothetical protein
MRALLLTCLVIPLLVGCSGTAKPGFDVSIQNATDQPLTVGFVIHGASPEPRWMSPEDWTYMPLSRQPELWGMVLEPGQTMADHLSGDVGPEADPVLRVYAGKPTLAEALAISHGGDRLDLGLHPDGNNHFIVTNTGIRGGLSARLRHRQPAEHETEGK